MVDLNARELHLEEMALTLGVNRYEKRRKVQGAEADLPPGKFLFNKAIGKLAQAIDGFIDDVIHSKAKRISEAALLLARTTPEEAAAIAARRIIASLANPDGESFTAVAIAIGGLIEESIQWDAFTQAEPKLAKVLERKMAKATTEKHRRAVLRFRTKLNKSRPEDWSKQDRLRVGTKLIELFEDATGFIEVTKVAKDSGRVRFVIRPTEELRRWLAEKHQKSALLCPMYLPMVVEPDPWSNPFDGGYKSEKLKRRALVRTRGNDLLEEIANVDMPDVYSAVNAVQSTPWKINRGVYDVVREALDRGMTLGGLLPDQEPLPRPERPTNVPENVPFSELTPEQQEAVKAYCKERAAVEQRDHQRIAEVIKVRQQVDVIAKEFLNDEAIYFPHYLDFRGRMYPMPSGVSPQADDLGRALLQFADGLPLGEEGAYWLAVHVANLWGQDKLPLDERVAWTMESADKILDSAIRPLDGDMFWLEADKPWCALAAAMEWTGAIIELRTTGKFDGYVSYLPIAMDGSCSGLQHYSALLRDEVGGRAVNLTADGERHDIYSEVKTKVELRLETCQGDGIEYAAAWKGKVTRSIVKRPVMTYAYSVTTVGMRDQILDEVRKASRELGRPYLGEGVDEYKACGFLASLVLEAIEDTVKAAAGAMDYLRELSRIVTDAGLPLRWRAPNGMLVIQRSRKNVSKMRNFFYAGRRIQLRWNEDTMTLDKRAQSSGIAPNFIHSMDAAHLMRTVNALHRLGIRYFAMIHDSFATHAANTGLLNRVLREEFVRMYEERDWLAEFAAQQKYALELAKVTAPAPPQMGNLDISEVLDSEFFFS